MTQYHIQDNAPLLDVPSNTVAKKAGGGYLVSMGNALAMKNVYQFLSHGVTDQRQLDVVGDKSGHPTENHMVILGSSANNHFAQEMFNELYRYFDFPYVVDYNQATGEIAFRSHEDPDLRIEPDIREHNGNFSGTDYAIVIKMKDGRLPSRYVVILAGAYMWGTEAASLAVKSRQILAEVARQSGDASDVAFLLRTNIVNSLATGPRLLEKTDRSYYISALRRRTHGIVRHLNAEEVPG
jgi:hypothetical protein